ncbi:protocadherin gamma-A5 isoform X27 [Kryptolebias marmoratus]|uniref:protocadherin gamma-A5 isoform X27 n=1 Tax=Kryptolebias marmoratus TaxID=37003 RepID=UPI0018ACAC05|nr:protocadherin gamma-A5 isoform X27 [Kryptolebias marmoratus]
MSCGLRAYSGWVKWRFGCGHGLLLLVFHCFFCCLVSGHIRYSIPEEMKKGSLIGNVAQDLGLDLKRLRSGRARIVSGENIQYTELKTDKGVLVVKERIDREQLCGETTPCSFSFEMILENPMELHQITVEITDINDHSPTFESEKVDFDISESATSGARFSLTSAEDEDVGVNGLKEYFLTENDHFVLKQHSNSDGKNYAEMVLQNPLDRETNPYLSLKLIAVDGGTPQRSGTVKIDVTVLDANDNAPVFNQSVYKATVTENSVKDTYITTVNATDGDFGSNSVVTYYFSDRNRALYDLFKINEKNGTIYVKGNIDFERDRKFELRIDAKDQGGLTDSSKVIIDVIDVNDNSPVIGVMSFTSPVSEDAPPGTTIGIINVKDLDSGENGQVSCKIEQNAPFKIKSNLRNYYTLVTDSVLDRESVSGYNITVVAIDGGIPPLSARRTFNLKVSDVNDNAPFLPQSVYSAFLTENNSPGFSVLSLRATDPDENQNARISYILEDSNVDGSPISKYVSVNVETGVVQAVRSFDYEHTKDFVFIVKAQDGGTPPLSSNVTVKIRIQDQNDNPPQILYPVQTGGSVVAEMVPRSADVGYLVTKVVAVDVDSGQNAWLSYKLQKATDRALFEVGLQNGEIRTIRQVTDKDAVKQRLTVIVEDNGQPSRSATVIVNVAVADSFPEVLSEFTDSPHEKEYNDTLTFYLVLALAVVSFLFITCLVVIISVKIYRWRQSRILFHSNLPVIPYYPPRYSDTLGTGTLQHVYNYEVCRTTDSRKSDCKFGTAASQNVLITGPSSTGTMQRIQSDKSLLDQPDSPVEQKPPNNDWRFTQGQRPGPSGATGGPEVAMGTGPWPQPPTEAEQLQALMAAANEVSEATATLGPGTMGLSTRYSPQFTLQHVPDYRQNVYIPGSTATLTSNPQQQQAMAQQATQQALPPPQASAQAEPPKAAQTPASKKKSTKKEKK